MSVSRRQFTVGAGAVGTALFAPSILRAQAYPSQDVHFICAFPAGGGADVIVRFFAEKMRPLMGRTIVVENISGALGNIAVEHVARSAPDGYTVLVSSPSTMAANQYLLAQPTVDILNEIQLAGTIHRQPIMIAVHKDSPYQSMDELTAGMKEKGDKASYCFTSPSTKVVGELYNKVAGLQVVNIPYRTAADYLNDLESGAIDFASADNVTAMSKYRSGDWRLLAISPANRIAAAPELPTMTELGYPMDLVSWWGLMVPKATPRPIVDQLNAWLGELVQSEEGKEFIYSIAGDPWVTTPDEAQEYWAKNLEDWGEYVKVANIPKQS